MLNVGLIDVDGHNFPNLALMKISAWHKAQGDDVEWCLPLASYDVVYQSKVFDETYSHDVSDPLNATEIIRGGTGYGLCGNLRTGLLVYRHYWSYRGYREACSCFGSDSAA